MTTTQLGHTDKVALTLETLAERMRANGDAANADKVRDLQLKWKERRLEVAFCGHFSAGKSSLINYLCGTKLLPSSPIPTSANLVRLAYGKPRIEIASGPNLERSVHPLDAERLGEWCRDGEDIRAVEIYDEAALLQDGIGLLDTPGIDSTDPAHRAATDAALHLADVVFYVMDYNHVQSEINFAFVKRIQQQGKPVFILVNQIDKHRREELSFPRFREIVEQGFASWDVEPTGSFYVSVKQPDHPFAEWDRLRSAFEQLRQRKEALILGNAGVSLRELAEAHMRAVRPEREQERERLAEQTADPAFAAAEERADGLETRLRELTGQAARQADQAKKEAQSVLDNANLTPADAREAAERYLESRKSSFRAGLLFAGKKTEQEKEARLAQFLELLHRQTETGAVLHLRNMAVELAKPYAGPDEAEQWAQQIANPITAAWIEERTPQVQVLTGEFVLNFCKTLAADIRASLRKSAWAVIDRCETAMQAGNAPAEAELRAELAECEQLLQAKRRLRQLAEEEARERASLLDGAEWPKEPLRLSLPPHPAGEDAAAPTSAPAPAPPQRGEGAFAAERLIRQAGGSAEWVERLRQAAELLRDVPAAKPLRDALTERASRMEARRYVFALFGAFSAGKSSFANALLGEAVLPVSPHPTTAAINRIVPPDEDNPHATALIRMKTLERLTDDVRFASEMLGIPFSGLEEALRQASRLRQDELHPKGRPHFGFLRAVQERLAEMMPKLGTTWRADMEQYREYAAQESRSCFVEDIELFYACPATDAGIVLVDTPGADSIHARHTGVAFQFMKEADAILFVTYYNHAFSQADREFLQQLGRVKDQFELDKMFFIVNASDLASSGQELEDVLEHVRGNLLAHGIRQPRMHPLSSLRALEAKRAGDERAYRESGIASFESALFDFVYGELGGMAERAAEADMRRAIERLRQWTEAARQDEASRGEQIRRRQAALRELEAEWSKLRGDSEASALKRELAELLHHVEQRTYFRFGEWINEAFHPSLWGGARTDTKTAMSQAWHELLKSISIAVSQELYATTLRMEQASIRALKESIEREADKAEAALPGFQAASPAIEPLPTPRVSEEFRLDSVTSSWLAGFFKNAKAFFEGDGKRKLREALEPKLVEALHAFVGKHAGEWEAFYAEQLSGRLRAALDGLRAELVELESGWAQADDSSLHIEIGRNKIAKLEQLLPR